MRYILAEAPDPVRLAHIVQDLLDDGWELYGHPIFAGFTSRPPAYAQALTNEKHPSQSSSEEIDRKELVALLGEALQNTVALNPEQQEKRERAVQILSRLEERAKSLDPESEKD